MHAPPNIFGFTNSLMKGSPNALCALLRVEPVVHTLRKHRDRAQRKPRSQFPHELNGKSSEMKD